MYPHIATTDGKGAINATWLRSLNNRNYHFTDWQDEKAFKAVIGPKGERAIVNGDILPSPAGLPFMTHQHIPLAKCLNKMLQYQVLMCAAHGTAHDLSQSANSAS